MPVPKSHPRYVSLKTRDKIGEGVEKGITSIHGLIAHGRGEAFDYLLGEKTNDFALKAIEAACAMLLLAKSPIISVNGNTAALVPKEIVALANLIPAKIEVNIFHASKEREKKIKEHLIENGAKEVLLPQKKCKIGYLESNRKYVNPEGIFLADVVFVPLEDGDRTEALIKSGKKVITIDLNPMSRTAKSATITIVDNVTRAVPLMIEKIRNLKEKNNSELKNVLSAYNNRRILSEAINIIKKGKLILVHD